MPETPAEQIDDEQTPAEELPPLIILEGAEDAPVCENGVCL
ncbi:hypothetical protein Aph02nite_80400 [Actinoplanes philippinensis]|uniref:Mycofactocin n=1 Tax=Actinoplanes philippinensis TaxID=35752 RepID=A0A1I2KW31_9ACTN|nr:hypothetical protein [Actinoplanes philippinensis]GIE82090.1 hypothetical protein Aph02nite_80400 [Actinoplanes philippinensis]SFF69387.1 hypothetical protein SAMN05421541_11852 [Actinoplanes philippinensis]